MSSPIEVVSVNISTKKGTIKQPVDRILIDAHGILEDAHRGPWHRQVSLLSRESIDMFSKRSGRSFANGEFAENITLKGIDLSKVALLDRFRIGSVELEVTQIGKKCHGDGCAIYREVGQCIMPKEGLFCRVIEGGEVRSGQDATYLPKTLAFLILTVSDRASKGEYQDLAGPRVKELLQAFLSNKRWHHRIDSAIIPDDSARLTEKLHQAKQAGVDVVVTTGGTGIGPRDITPDIVMKICDKQLPGIMDAIRIKYGMSNPNALLSRSVAGVTGKTLIFTLPGSVKAVGEYIEEISKILEHLLLMLHGLDAH